MRTKKDLLYLPHRHPNSKKCKPIKTLSTIRAVGVAFQTAREAQDFQKTWGWERWVEGRKRPAALAWRKRPSGRERGKNIAISEHCGPKGSSPPILEEGG